MSKKSWEDRVRAEIAGTCAHGETADSHCDICHEAEIRLEQEELQDEDVLFEEEDGDLEAADGQEVANSARIDARRYTLSQLEDLSTQHELRLTLVQLGNRSKQLQVN